ncbi:MAG: ribosomal-processing cysteine protease Prp [Eubacterium sp.]|nr:ribosomal-processing cysteine protease Prp [Eubacterium sp.]MCM1304260.1 ribosomal-processing cysteine protease Prp [Butyrivibrio sp.]MCM1345021.1 ribosomal-processing cysteine protease Prp [Muribaculaceae bacterium]MCM1409671.1 ribosomal-processing cysteine protease Prp [Lachnospiraceae bacterium]
MITVEIHRTKNHGYKGFCCIGHAEYAKPGQPDIVCAAVSALTIGTVNALEELAGEKLTVTQNEASGFFKCDFESVLQDRSNFLMDFMVFSLENIRKEYGKKYLKVNIKEV